MPMLFILRNLDCQDRARGLFRRSYGDDRTHGYVGCAGLRLVLDPGAR